MDATEKYALIAAGLKYVPPRWPQPMGRNNYPRQDHITAKMTSPHSLKLLLLKQAEMHNLQLQRFQIADVASP